MDRTTLLSYLRQNNPNKADYSDDELLWETAKQAETDGIIGKYPVLQNEILRQRAALEAQDRGLIGNTWAATKRGFAQGAQGMNVLAGMDETNAKDVAGWEQTKIANPNSPEFVEFMQAKGFKDSAKAFFKSPVRIISEVMAESAAGSLPALGAGFAGGTIQGAIAGGGTPAEAVTIPVGAMIGTAVGSGTVEYASKVLEVMQSEGMDISDPASIQKFFDDPDRLARAREHAVKKAIPVALFDGATVGLASKFGGKGLRNIAKGIGSEATGGMAGEYLGQQLAGEDTDWKSVAMEGIAEVGSLPGDLASTWRASNAAPVAKTNIMQPEAKPEAVATPLGVSFPEIRNTAPAAPATPAETSAIPTPVPTVEQPAKERPVLADFATQKALVEAGVRADEASLYTQDEANGFLEEFANMQANAEQEVQDAAIEVAAQQQAVARAEAKANGAQMQETHRLLAAQEKAEQQNLIAQEKAVREQRMAQIQAKQAQLAAQRSEVDSLVDNPQPLLPFIESRTPMRGTGLSRQVDMPAVAKKQMAMRTDKLAAEIAAANKATPTVQTTPLTGKLETPSTEFSIPQVKIESPVAPSVAQEPVTAPQDAPQVAAKPRFRDELTAPEQTVLLDRSTVLDPNQSLESVLGEYGMANRLLGGRSHSNQLLVLKDKDGKFYQVPVKRKNLRGSFETVVMPYATKQTYLSWLSEEFGGTARRALFGSLKDKATTQKVLERAKEFGHGETFDPEVRTWLNKNQNLTPVMLLETKERVNSGFRPASDEMAGRIERELLGRRNREVESDVVVTDTIGKKFAVKIGSKEYTVVRDSEAKTWKLDGGEALGATKPAAVEALKSKYGFKDTVHELPPVAPSVAQEPVAQQTPELPKVTPVSPMHRGLTVTDPSKAGRTLAAALYNTVFKKKGPEVWNTIGRKAVRDADYFMQGVSKTAAKLQKENPKDDTLTKLLSSLNTETDRDAVVLHGQEALYRMLNRLAEDNGHALDFDENEIAADRFESKQDDRATSDIEAKEAKGDLREGGMSVIRPHVESSADYLDATDRYHEVLDLTRQRGISVMQTEAAKAMREGGAYNVSNRTVSLTLRDVLRPSRSNLISLVHEVVHDITETAPEYVRMALHDAFDRLDAKKLAFYGKALAGENAMSSVTERMVEHLTFKGVDADYSRSILATVYRTVKDLILRGAQFLQAKMVGKENTSGTLATAWAENRVAMFLSGDDAKIGDFLDQFRTPSVGVLVRAVGGETFFNASTGATRYERIEHLDAAPLNVQAAADAVIRTAKMTGQWTLGQDATALGETLYRDEAPRNTEGKLLAPNGKVSKLTEHQWRQVRTTEFKAWFGDWENGEGSKIVDPETGEPMVVYHGTKADFTEFRNNTPAGEAQRVVKDAVGFYFSGDREIASAYARADRAKEDSNGSNGIGSRVVPVYLNIRNPKKHSGDGFTGRHTMSVIRPSEIPEFTRDGVDGLSYDRVGAFPTPFEEVVAFFPNQIKSAVGNSGAFAPGDANILKHVEPDAQRIGSLVVQATRKEARIASAAANSINAIMKQLFDRVKKSEPEYTSAQLKALKRLGDLPAKPVEDLTALYRLIGVTDPTNAKAGAIAKLKSILQEEFGQAPDGPIFDEGAQVDTLEGVELAGANKSIYRWTSSVDAKVRARIIELRDQLTDLEQSEPLRRAEIQAIYSQLGDSKVSYAAMVRNISETIESLRRDLRKTNDVSETLGEATATLAALEDASDRQTLNQKYTEKALDGVSVNDVPLGSALKALYDLGIDLQSASPKEIRDRVREEVLINEDSPLAAFIRSDLRGTALLASMIRFVKNDALVAETIRAQMSRSKEDLAQLNEARDIWLASSDREVDEAREAIKQLRPTGDAAKLSEQPAMTPRLAHRMINVLDENLARQAEIAKVRRDLEVLRSAQPAFTQLNRQAAQRLKAGDSVAFHTGARYLDPVDADTSEEVLTTNAKKFVLSGPNAMKATDLHSLIERTADWVAARENNPDQQGEVYETMVQQLRLLRKNVYGDEHHKLVAGLFNGRLMGLADLFRRTGTRPGDVAARALTRFDGIMRVFGSSDATKGQKFETLRDNCIRVMGIEPQRLNELFYNDALWVAQTWQGSAKEYFDFLSQRYKDSEYFQRPGASDALFSLLRSIPENNRYAMEKMKHSGADRVYDEQLGRERSHIETGLEGFTIPRNVNPVLRNWLALFDREFVAGDSAENPFREVDRLVATEEGIQILRQSLARLFDESGWATFLRPLLTNELGGVPGPNGAEIHPQHIAGLLEKSGNDLVAFADAAFDKFGGEDRNAYRASLVKWVNQTWSKLDSQFNPQKSGDTVSLGIPEVAINARTMTGPKEWFVFTQFTPGDHRRMTHGIAATGCFGRNGATLKKLADDVQTALAADKDKVERLDNVDGWEQLKKTKKAEWQRLMAVKKYSPPEWGKVLESTFNNEADFFVENHAALETFGTAVSGMTAGMKSALKNLITPSNMIYLQRSASLETMADAAGAYGKTGKIFLAALADCFGVRLFRNDPFVQALVREGVFDAATRTTVKDLATGERGVNDNLGSYARTLRQIRNVFVNTRLSPLSKDSMFPALRLLNPFQFTQIAVNMAGSWQLMQGYYEMADAAAQHYKNGGDRNKPLSAKDCGVSDDVRFNSLKAKLMDNGLTLEDLGQRLAKGQSILDRDFIQAVNNMSTGDLANEGGVNNRPLVMTRSRMGRVLGTFVGWQTAQTNHLLKLASDPQGRTNLLTLSRAAKVFALGMLPLSLAASAALDEWDELVDRKSNRRKIDLMDPQSISEALVAVGTTGMLGDALDYSINTAQGSSGNNDMLSLDNRIVLVNSARSVFNAVRNAVAMGDVNYANFGRPLLQGLGAGGIIQNAYLMDKIAQGKLRALPVIGEPFAAEHSIALRSNVGNYLRAAGRDIGLEVRRSGGGDYTPTPLTPHITNMYLAALSDDRETFQKEYQAAIKTAASMGKADPFKAVQQSFGSRHPLKSIFMSAPSAGEYQRLLGSMPDEGKAAVRDAVRLVNTYGASLGVDPFAGDETPQVRRAPIGLLDRLRSQLADDRVF